MMSILCWLLGHKPIETDWHAVDNNYLPPYYVKWIECMRCSANLGKRLRPKGLL